MPGQLYFNLTNALRFFRSCYDVQSIVFVDRPLKLNLKRREMNVRSLLQQFTERCKKIEGTISLHSLMRSELN